MVPNMIGVRAALTVDTGHRVSLEPWRVALTGLSYPWRAVLSIYRGHMALRSLESDTDYSLVALGFHIHGKQH